MRRLLAATALTPLVMIHAAALAETTISTATTTKVQTSTVKNGAADDITISSAGSITPTSSPAVLIDSNNKVSNAGTITVTDVANGTAIQALAGRTSTITNSGTITGIESAEADDSDDDGDADGPFATGSNRFGVHVTGAGTFTGTITNSGTIGIQGNTSGGMAVDGTLAGNLTQSGTIAVLGNDSAGIRLSDVTGTVSVTGTTSATGGNAVGVALDGDVGGAVQIQGTVSSTGYRYTTAPTGDALEALDSDDLLQGGPAVRISGNVAKGIILDIPPTDASDTDTDEDDDGVADADEGSAAVTTFGSAPALLVGSGDNITIGAVTGKTDGLIINGAVSASGVYSGLSATGVTIGGQGGTVSVAGGATIGGTVSATSVNGSAAGLRIGSGATVPTVTVTGAVTASGGGDEGSTIRAIQIDAGAHVTSIVNSGTIAAVSPGTLGVATAIYDRSDSLKTITNTGAIGSSVQGSTQTGRVIALDLAANTSGVTYTQSLSTAENATAPSLTGDIVTGSGNDVIDIRSGSATGAMNLAAGNDQLKLSGSATASGNVDLAAGDDTVSLSGTSSLVGNLGFGAGSNTLTLSDTASYSGAISFTGGSLAVNVAGGTLNATNTGSIPLSSLAVSGSGTIAVNVNGATGSATRYDVAGAASFAAGSKIDVRVASFLAADKSYTVVDAGTLTGANNIALVTDSLPFLFKADLATDAAAGTVNVDVARKTAGELGLNRSGGEAYDAVYQALSGDTDLGGTFLQIADQQSFVSQFSTLLPDHAGGIFESVTQGSRSVARTAADPNGIRARAGGLAFWIGQSTWREKKGVGDTASYSIEGWGFSGGLETALGGIGTVGVSLAYLVNNVDDDRNSNNVDGYQYEGSLYWRGVWGPINADAHASVGRVNLKSERDFSGALGDDTITRTANAKWKGTLYTAGGSVGYTANLGRFDLRPTASIDYYNLDEGSRSETGGGTGFNLDVDGRKSDELAATGSVVLGINFGSLTGDNGWARVELEGGRRQIVGGSLGDTTAHFEGGQDFTLTADDLKSGFLGRLRAMGGNEGFRVGGEVGVEQLQGRAAYSLRASLRLAF